MKIKREILIILTLLVLVGGFLRFHNLFTQSIWLDESLQLYIVGQPTLKDMMGAMREDHSPPLSHFLLYFWMKFFNTPEHSRVVSAIVGTLSIAAFFFLAQKFLSSAGALFATLLFTLSATHIWASQETRPYFLFVLTIIISYYTFVSWTEEPTRKKLAFYVLAVVLSFYTHYYSFFFIIPQAVYAFLIFEKKKQFIRELICALIIACILFTPWLLKFSRTFNMIIENRFVGTIPTLNNLLMIAIEWAGGTLGLLLITFLAGKYFCEKNNKRTLILLWLTIPVAIPFIISNWHQLFHKRYIVPAILPLFLLAGGGFEKLNKLPKILTVIAVILLSIIPIQGYYGRTKDQWRDAAAFVAQQHNSGEKILFDAEYAASPFSIYFTEQKDFVKTDNSTVTKLPEITQNQTAIWLISYHASDKGELVNALQNTLPNVTVNNFVGITIRRFSKLVEQTEK